MREFLAHPEVVVAQVLKLQRHPPPGKIRVDPEEWPLIARGLLEAGVFRTLRADQFLCIAGLPFLNSCFGLEKPELLGALAQSSPKRTCSAS